MKTTLSSLVAAVACFFSATSASALTYTPDSGNGVYSFDFTFTATKDSTSGILAFVVKDYFSSPGPNSNSQSGSVTIYVNDTSVPNLCTCDLGAQGFTFNDIGPNDFLFSTFATGGFKVGDVLRFITTDSVPDVAQGALNLTSGPAFLLTNLAEIASDPVDINDDPASRVPLPAAAPLLMGGLASLAAVRRRKKRFA